MWIYTQKERIAQIANEIIVEIYGTSGGSGIRHVQYDCIKLVLEKCPEFRDPWVLCSERMPPNGAIVVLKHETCRYTITDRYDDAFGTSAIAWMEITPFNPPESELVRRFREKLNDKSMAGMAAISALKEVEQELKAEK